MVQTYLVKRKSGRWYAKYRKPDGKWSHRSLYSTTKAAAQVRYSQFLKQLEERELLFSEIRPLRLREFADEYLRYVKSHKSSSWHSKRSNYLHTTILPFFGADTHTTAPSRANPKEASEEGSDCRRDWARDRLAHVPTHLSFLARRIGRSA